MLFCAWLAWSRFRVVVPLWDKSLPSVVIGLDRAFRYFDGVPTYALTDNEKTVSVDHVAGIAVRNQQIVLAARHYGVSIQTCMPADPQSKGGSENTVKIAKADLVPTDHNLRDEYESMAEVEAACEQWMSDVNTRPHRSTQEPPVIRLAEEHERLQRVPTGRTPSCLARPGRSAGSPPSVSAARSTRSRTSSSTRQCGSAPLGMS